MSNWPVLLGLTVFSVSVALPVLAEEKKIHTPSYQMTNTTLINDPSAGAGIEMIFEVDELPEGGLTGSIAQRDLGVLCKTWAQFVITHVAARTNSPPPKFLSVMVKYGGVVGIYGRIRFSTDGKQCLESNE